MQSLGTFRKQPILLKRLQEAYYEALSHAGKKGYSTVFIGFMLETIKQALENPGNEIVSETRNDTLKEAGFLIREGAKKNGRWKVQRGLPNLKSH